MALIKYPYTNLHELNLDWLIEQLNNPDGPVKSVNGKSGIVTLTGEDIARSTSNPETVAAALQTQGSSIQTVRNQIGVTALPTVAQTLTGAIAENAQEIADVEDNVIGSTTLPTTAQTLTGAIAENAGDIADIVDTIGSTALPTTAQTLTGAIAENSSRVTNISTNIIGNTPMGTTATTVTGAIAEHESDLIAVNNELDVCGKIAPVNWEPAGDEASVTSGTAVTIAPVSSLIPSGATARGVIMLSAYGSSNYDYSGTLMIVGGNLRYMPRLTQGSIRVYGAIIYTL